MVNITSSYISNSEPSLPLDEHFFGHHSTPSLPTFTNELDSPCPQPSTSSATFSNSKIAGVLAPSTSATMMPHSITSDPATWTLGYQLARSVLRGKRFARKVLRTMQFLWGGQVANFSVVRQIGRGSEGTVYLSTHPTTLERAFAIKSVPTLTFAKKNDIKRQVALIRSLQQHENIVKVVAVHRTLFSTNIVMDYCEGGEIFQYLSIMGRMEENLVWHIFRQLFSAIDYMHSHNICHRDLKLENIFVDKDFNVKIGDFGFATYQAEGELCEGPCGSPEYVAPEVLTSKAYDGFQADVWSLGVVLYTLLQGQYPFCPDGYQYLLENIKNARFRGPDSVSFQVKDLIRSGMLVVDPLQRFTISRIKRHIWLRRKPVQ
ncbi:uncharacterized protein VTP21DRAFT_2028 [Calcarisporiella thermophila]|uniref:uncharacterized protein n=1 Tax=Calcarisporiella thermophila TaxID=911321 RepID=UPI0037423D6B